MGGEWFYTTNFKQMGPVTWQELCSLAETGVLKPHDLIWSEGMSDWVKASNQEGLFTEDADTPAGAIAETRPPAGRPTAPNRDPQEDRRAEDEEEDKRTKRIRKRRRPAGMGLGLKVLLIGGATLLILAVLACTIGGLVFLAVGGGDAFAARTQDYTINNLEAGGMHERHVEFQKGKRIVITVDSTVNDPITDVDLIVLRGPQDNIIAGDFGLEKDCRVEFHAPATGGYRLRVINHGPGMAERCKVTITER